MGATVKGLISGIDVDSFIDQMVGIKMQDVARVENEKAEYELQIDAYSSLKSLISTFESKASELSEEENFNLFSVNNSDESIVTFDAGEDASEGTYDLKVFQRAQSEKMVSADGLITSQTDPLSSFGVTAGEISINGTNILIDAEDTLQDLRMKINNASDSEGNDLGVTASVLKIADDNFRLVLSSDNEGSAGIEYKDVSGSTLQDLGIIQTADGEKGNQNQVFTSSGDISAAFSALAEGESIVYSGTDRNGNEVNNTFIKEAGSTIEDLAKQMEKTFYGIVDVTVNGDGTLSVADKVYGESRLNIGSFSVGGTEQDFSVTSVGKNGDGVLSTGTDAYFSIDGIDMVSEDNEADDFIPGVTITLHKESVDTSVTVGLERDYDAITKKVQDMVSAFNEIHGYVTNSTSYGDLEDEEDTSRGILAGDMTARSVLTRLKALFQHNFDLVNDQYKSFSQIGLKTKTSDGSYKLDEDKFKEALKENFGEVKNMFVSKGYSSNSNITLGLHNKNTVAGDYVMEEVDPETVRIRLDSEAEWYTSSSRHGDVITFDDGPANGLSLTFPSGAAGGGSVSFTFSRGLSDLIANTERMINDNSEGMISVKQNSLNNSVSNALDRIDQLERRAESYRQRLINQFSYLEQSMSELQAQSSNLLSAIS